MIELIHSKNFSLMSYSTIVLSNLVSFLSLNESTLRMAYLHQLILTFCLLNLLIKQNTFFGFSTWHSLCPLSLYRTSNNHKNPMLFSRRSIPKLSCQGHICQL